MVMVLIDAVFINNGGGLILLNYLVNYLESNNLKVFYLFDDRTRNLFNHIPESRKKFIKNSLIRRHFFYINNREEFKIILCFGNLPPTTQLKAKVLVYFHQNIFLNIPKNFSFKNKFIYFLKQNILNFIKNNADVWLVQSESVRSEFSYKYFDADVRKVIKFPFYPELDFSGYNVNRVKHSFLYVSNSSSHKNHYKLIEAFCLAYDEIKKGHLTLTVPILDINLCNFINKKITLGYPIENVGFIERQKLAEIYLSHEYLIFPSLSESFGLGLAEAIDGGCKIIAADLKYTYEVCKPSLVFDPLDIESIKDAILYAIQNELPYAKKLINNDISKIMQLLVEK